MDVGLLVLQEITNTDSQDPSLHFRTARVIWSPSEELHRLVLVEGIQLGLVGHSKGHDVLEVLWQRFRPEGRLDVPWLQAVGKELGELVRIRSGNQSRSEFVGDGTKDLGILLRGFPF